MLGLAFSGGKDSLACWYLVRKLDPVVFWVNTGKAYPETLALVEELRAEAKEFIEIRSDQDEQNRRMGLPSDLVPGEATVLGSMVGKKPPVLVQSNVQCCYENIARPIWDAVKKRGVTKLVRGQRKDETFKSSSKNGSIFEGVTVWHPIEDWSAEKVLKFIQFERGSVPDHFSIEHSSLDCYDCTGFMAHSRDRVAWTKERHPEFYEKYAERLKLLRSACAPAIHDLEVA